MSQTMLMFQTRCDCEAWAAVTAHKKARGVGRVRALDTPATSIDASVSQARTALRAFRQSIKDGAVLKADPTLPYCCRVCLPQPHPGEESTIQILQDEEFPGGVLQKFRKLRPAVDDLLFGYEPEFVGMVPDPGDGVGVWRCTTDLGMSVICNANTLTLETLIDLCEGKYGPGPTRPDHCIVAVNCTWGTGEDVGQFWQRELKERATAVIEERVWHDVYHLAPLKTASGATGWLYHAWGSPWKVYSCSDDEAKQKGDLLKEFSEAWAAGGQSLRPESTEVAELLGAAADERDPRRKVSIRLW